MSAPRGDDVLTQSHVAVSGAQDYFDLLPNEIFTLVLDFVHGPEVDFRYLTKRHPKMKKKTLLNLALVSRRFNALATPLLYKYINVVCESSQWNKWTEMELLHRTLKEQIYLQRYIRKLRLEYYAFQADEYLDREILEMLGSTTHLTHLMVYGTFSYGNKMILDLIEVALANFTSLRQLAVVDADKSIWSSNIIKALTKYPSKIQELLLDGMFCNDESSLSFVPPQNNDTASLRTLHVHNIVNNPEATINSLLKWSKSLTTLSVEGDRHGYPHSNLRIDLKTLFSPFKDTLVVLYLALCILPERIDFSSLVALEKLTLIYWPLIASTRVEFSENVGRRLLAPQLRRLTWLVVEDHRGGLSMNSLSTHDEKWLCDLGEYAAQHCSRLRIIRAQDYLRWTANGRLDMRLDIFGRVQCFFETLGLVFLSKESN